MISSIAGSRSSDATGSIVAWVRDRPWAYAFVVIALFGFVPEIRRVIDWKSSFTSISIISVLPFMALVPGAYALFLTSRFAKLERTALIAAWLWLGAFGYAYLVGVATGNAIAASYAFLTFVLPMGMGLFVSTLRVPAAELYERIAKFSLAISVPISAYAIYQYVSPPPWDVYWVHQAGIPSIGLPYPFQLRAFGTLNAPAGLADYLGAIIILNFPRVRGSRPLILGAIALDLAAFILTMVRGDWIAVVIAVIVFIALRPKKIRNLSAIAFTAVLLTFVIGNAGTIFGSSQLGLDLAKRFDTFTQLGDDGSFRERQEYFGNTLAVALGQPTGAGLGVTGTAAKLGSSGDAVVYDNGYIARLTEMGYFGTLAYVATIGMMFVATLRRWRSCERAGDARAASIAAAALGLQAALIFLDVSFDHHSQLSGVFFWLAFGLVFAGRPERFDEPVRSV